MTLILAALTALKKGDGSVASAARNGPGCRAELAEALNDVVELEPADGGGAVAAERRGGEGKVQQRGSRWAT